MKAIDIIKDLVIKESGIDITKRSRNRKAVEIRSLYYNVAKTLKPTLTYTAIGDSIGLDHTTVLYSLSMYEVYSTYNKELNKLKEIIIERYRIENKFYAIHSIDDEIQILERRLNELTNLRDKLRSEREEFESEKNQQENLVV